MVNIKQKSFIIPALVIGTIAIWAIGFGIGEDVTSLFQTHFDVFFSKH